jgi:hypothetical protein
MPVESFCKQKNKDKNEYNPMEITLHRQYTELFEE